MFYFPLPRGRLDGIPKANKNRVYSAFQEKNLDAVCS